MPASGTSFHEAHMSKLVASLAAAMVLGGCTTAIVEIDQPTVCAIAPAAVFMPGPKGVTATLPVDFGSAQGMQGAGPVTAELLSATVVTRGGQDLGFARAARVSTQAPTPAPGPQSAVISGMQAPNVRGGILSVEGNGADLVPAMTQGRTTLTIEIDGAPPRVGFLADVGVCVGLQPRAN